MNENNPKTTWTANKNAPTQDANASLDVTISKRKALGKPTDTTEKKLKHTSSKSADLIDLTTVSEESINDQIEQHVKNMVKDAIGKTYPMNVVFSGRLTGSVCMEGSLYLPEK